MAKPGPKTPEGKARSLANLIPAKPGEVRNKNGGHRAAGASVKEWINVMQEWTAAEVAAVLEDGDAPMNKRAAARVWLDAASKDKNAAGMPVAGADLDRIMDRTVGKPTQAVELTGRDGGPIATETKPKFDYDAFRQALSDSRRVRAAGGLPAPNGN